MTRLLTAVTLWALLLLPALAQKKPDDSLIYDQVRMRLANDPDIKGGHLTVDVKDGVVTVSGRVDREKARAKVDRVAKKVKGVTQVQNQVQVAQ
jgi:osmotically-inducible protein OsmY